MPDTIDKTIYVSDRDRESLMVRLSLLTDARSRRMTEKLRRELERAVVLPAKEMPPNVVQIGSQVRLLDLDSKESEQYTVVAPEQADVARGYLSVLAPLGTALLGFSRGDEISWEMPGGTRHLRIEDVTAPQRAV